MEKRIVGLVVVLLFSLSMLEGMKKTKPSNKIEVNNVEDFDRVIALRDQYRQNRSRGFFSEEQKTASQSNQCPTQSSKVKSQDKK